MISREEFSAFRAACLTNNGADLEEVHGMVTGLLVAIERVSTVPPEETDKLIAELRASVPPEHPFDPLPNFKGRCVICGKPPKHPWHGWIEKERITA